MRRYALALLATLLLAVVGDHAVLAQNANAPQDNCDARHRKDNPDLQRAKEAKKAQLRARGYPERFMKLIDREECIACVEIASDAFHIMIVYKDNDYAPTDYKTGKKWTLVSHVWDPETEVLAREKTKDGTIKGFYILNTLSKGCRCCGDTADGHTTPQSYSDWDEDLGANKDHLIPFDQSNIGPLPEDLEHPSDKWVGDPVPTPQTFTKPAKKQSHAPCPACETAVTTLNQAYDAIDKLWTEKNATLDARELKGVELAKTENEIRLLWYKQRSSTMSSAANQQRIEELEAASTKLEDAMRADFQAAEAKDAAIAAQQRAIELLEKAAADCAAKCSTTIAGTPAAAVAVNAPPRAAPSAIVDTPPAPQRPPTRSFEYQAPEFKAACAACEEAARLARSTWERKTTDEADRDNAKRAFDALMQDRNNADETYLKLLAVGAGNSASAEFAAQTSQEAGRAMNRVQLLFSQAQARVNDSTRAHQDALAELNTCNERCTTVEQPVLPPAEVFPGPVSVSTTGPEPCFGDSCSRDWSACEGSGNCRPVETDCGIPGVCTDTPAASEGIPFLDLSTPTAWDNIIKIETEIRVQEKMVDLMDASGFGRYSQQPFSNSKFRIEPENRSSPAPVFRGAPALVIPAYQQQGVRQWFDPLGLLARRLVDHVDRWRASVGPRPLIRADDLKVVERYSDGQAVGLPKGVHVLLTDQGGSTGKTLLMQILNLSGQPVRLSAKPFAVQPIKQQAQQQVQQAFSRLAKAAPVQLNLSAYCVEFLKAPPGANTLLKLAPADVQQKYASMSKILQSSYRVAKADALHPDSNPAAYTDSIKQWAIWTVEQKLNESRYTAAFVGHTKKNVEAAGQQWSKPAEDMVRKVSPNRWRDIVKVLQGAGVPVPQ